MDRTLISQVTSKVGEKVKLQGWVDTIRDHGKITFIDLRDRSSLVQCVGSDLDPVTPESVVEIIGTIANRPEKLINKNIETGTVEIQIETLRIISKALELPIPIEGDGWDIDEKVRLKYR